MFKKYVSLYAFLSLVLLYLLLRCGNLTYLPYFGDEAEYMWYAFKASHDPTQGFLSLGVGKQPLYIWISAFFIKIFRDPLLAGRLVSVTAGLLTMLGVWLLTLRLFKNNLIAFIAVAVFIFNPFTQMTNRFANYDSTVGLFYIWSLYFTVLLVQTVRLDVAYTLGLALAGGILTKSNAFFSLYLLPVSLLVFNFAQKERKRKLLKLALLFAVAAIIANLFYMLLQLSPYYERILWFNGAFVYPKREWLELSIDFRLNIFRENTAWLFSYFSYYLTYPYLAMIIAALWFGRKQARILLLLIAYAVFPIFALAIFGKWVIASRWIYPFVLPLLPVIAFGVFSLYGVLVKKLKKYPAQLRPAFLTGLIIAIVGYPAIQAITFTINPHAANIHPVDKGQYVSCATWSFREIMTKLRYQARDQKIFIGSRFPLAPGQQISQLILLYALPNKNIVVKGYDMSLPSYPANFFNYAKTMPAYFVTYKQWDNLIKGKDKLKLIVELSSPHDPHCSKVLMYKAI